jgi:hypothetical protein
VTVPNPRTARLYANLTRDVGSALVVGGSTVALALLLGGLAVRKDVYVALQVIQGVLFTAAPIFIWRATLHNDVRLPRWMSGLLLLSPLAFIGYVTVFVLATSNSGWPNKPYSSAWWSDVGLALLMAIYGTVIRYQGDSLKPE